MSEKPTKRKGLGLIHQHLGLPNAPSTARGPRPRQRMPQVSSFERNGERIFELRQESAVEQGRSSGPKGMRSEEKAEYSRDIPHSKAENEPMPKKAPGILPRRKLKGRGHRSGRQRAFGETGSTDSETEQPSQANLRETLGNAWTDWENERKTSSSSGSHAGHFTGSGSSAPRGKNLKNLKKPKKPKKPTKPWLEAPPAVSSGA